ncbi:MAG: DUF4364 family protein [Eubacterium sp.]|jgi:hypothetical protein|nr:DUF4364 family protein [Eubacterium sp.]
MNASKSKINDTLLAAVLICSLLKEVRLTETGLLEILTDGDTVGQFVISDALSLIEKKSLAALSDDGAFSLTEAGVMIVDEFIGKIPFEIREKCLVLAKRISSLSELDKSVKWEIENLERGCYFKLRFLNEMGGSDIIDLKIYAPSYESALKMQENFLEKPIDAFERIMYIFTRD